MAWEPDRRYNFFFSPPAHLCAVTYMTEISLIVTLNNQFNPIQSTNAWDTYHRHTPRESRRDNKHYMYIADIGLPSIVDMSLYFSENLLKQSWNILQFVDTQC